MPINPRRLAAFLLVPCLALSTVQELAGSLSMPLSVAREMAQAPSFGSQALAGAGLTYAPALRGFWRNSFRSLGGLLKSKPKVGFRMGWVPDELLARYPQHDHLLRRLCGLDILDALELPKILADRPAEFDRAVAIMAQHPDAFLEALTLLARPAKDYYPRHMNIELHRAFAAFPEGLFSTVQTLNVRAFELTRYVDEDDTINLEKFLMDHDPVRLVLDTGDPRAQALAPHFKELLALSEDRVGLAERPQPAENLLVIKISDDAFEASSDGLSLFFPAQLIDDAAASLTSVELAIHRRQRNSRALAHQREARFCAGIAIAGAILRRGSAASAAGPHYPSLGAQAFQRMEQALRDPDLWPSDHHYSKALGTDA